MSDKKSVAPKEGAFTRSWNWLTETQAWKSIFRHDMPTTDRNRVLVMLSNVFLHLHPVRIRKSGVKLRYTWCMGGLSFFLFLSLTLTAVILLPSAAPAALRETSAPQVGVPTAMTRTPYHGSFFLRTRLPTV